MVNYNLTDEQRRIITIMVVAEGQQSGQFTVIRGDKLHKVLW